MRPTTSRLAVLAACSALVLAGCSGSDGGDGQDAGATQTAAQENAEPTAEATADPTADEQDDATSTDAPTDEATAGGDAEAAEATDLSDRGLEDRHQNGAVLSVQSVRVDRTGVVIGVSVINGHTHPVSLNARRMYVLDDRGNGYNFRPPAQNSNLTVEPGAELAGDLVFLGVVPQDATSLTLKTNVFNADENIDKASRFNKSRHPSFMVEGIPVD